MPAQGGIDIPLPLRKQVEVAQNTKEMAVCTYTHTGTADATKIDAFSAPDSSDEADYDKRQLLIANRDNLCNPLGFAGTFQNAGDKEQLNCINPNNTTNTDKCFSYLDSDSIKSQSDRRGQVSDHRI